MPSLAVSATHTEREVCALTALVLKQLQRQPAARDAYARISGVLPRTWKCRAETPRRPVAAVGGRYRGTSFGGTTAGAIAVIAQRNQ